MAANPNSNIHNDAWQSDAYRRGGPAGANLQADSYQYPSSLCGTLAFDSKGRILTVCPSILCRSAGAADRRGDARRRSARSTCPTRQSPPGTKEFQNFSGGGYLFVDQRTASGSPRARTTWS